MPYARAEDLYEEIVTQIGDGHPDNAKEIALDALTSAFSDKSDDFIKPIVDVALNFGNCSRPLGWYGVASGGKRSYFWVDDGLGM